MAIKLTDWIKQHDGMQENPEHQIISCVGGHHTSINEMNFLKTGGFCPKCNLPVTETSDDTHTRMLENLGEESMSARERILETGEYNQTTQIPLDGSRFRVVQVGKSVVQVLV